jgi:hypothetical protein
MFMVAADACTSLEDGGPAHLIHWKAEEGPSAAIASQFGRVFFSSLRNPSTTVPEVQSGVFMGYYLLDFSRLFLGHLADCCQGSLANAILTFILFQYSRPVRDAVIIANGTS